MGQARNIVVVLTADVVDAVGGEFGTLSEISHTLKHGVPVVGIDTWPIDDMPASRSVPFSGPRRGRRHGHRPAPSRPAVGEDRAGPGTQGSDNPTETGDTGQGCTPSLTLTRPGLPDAARGGRIRFFSVWRKGWDSNPRGSSPCGFQDRCLRPLGHPSTCRRQPRIWPGDASPGIGVAQGHSTVRIGPVHRSGGHGGPAGNGRGRPLRAKLAVTGQAVHGDKLNGGGAGMDKRRLLYVAILGAVPFVMVLGNSMLIPVFPQFKRAMELTQFQAGLLITVFSAPAAIVIPFAGILSDHIGRRKVIGPACWCTAGRTHRRRGQLVLLETVRRRAGRACRARHRRRRHVLVGRGLGGRHLSPAAAGRGCWAF